jgi:hypothetical protein
MKGYSGTPLWKKLGYKEGLRARLIEAPGNYLDLLEAPFAPTFDDEDDVDLVHGFFTDRAVLATVLIELRARLTAEAVVWVSWPKRASGVATDITEDMIREVALPLGFVDTKVCAVDRVWSGLKLVVRKSLR